MKDVLLANAIPSIVANIVLLKLPLRQVWTLVPTFQLRMQLVAVFSCGIL